MPHIGQDALATIKRALTLQGEWDKALEEIAKLDEHAATDAERAAAQDMHGSDEIEIDDDASTSRADEGLWVQAWVWVPHPDCDACKGLGALHDGPDAPKCEPCDGTGRKKSLDA